MPKKPKVIAEMEPKAYVHDDAKRKNIPEAGFIEYEQVVKEKTAKYNLNWDPREAPQLVWAGKAGMTPYAVQEQYSLEVPTVNLHIHERVSTEAIIRACKREDVQRSLFADEPMEFQKEVQYYQHDVNWANRMILGDSLVVMNSLVQREGMRGAVQCIYMDPPYGIKFGSNFQPRVDQRDVKDGKDDDLTREVMQVQAFRDTWELGVHSYLTYLRDRLLVARELLAESGSIFVQIGDENVHRVRCLMDEVFGERNYVSEVIFLKTTGLGEQRLDNICDYILWFCKDIEKVKYRQMFTEKEVGAKGATRYNAIDDCGEVYSTTDLRSQSGGETINYIAEFH